MTDLDIARSIEMKPIRKIAEELGLSEQEFEPYGHYKAKISAVRAQCTDRLILVTAINPTPMGEGKTTISIGLADGLRSIGKSVCLALREPSLGPVFGIKGGAAGGGHAQVVPMEDINLHFTGDLHAITSANNLIAAAIDNHLQQGNALQIDARKIVFKRCIDLNDRVLRNIVVGLGGTLNGVPREDGFTITAASEVMAVLCLAKDLADLKKRLGAITIGYDFAGQPVNAAALQVADAAAILLKDSIKPNLVQTLEGTPALIHGGPFANIAHGCNSIIATKMAMGLADYVVTEAGFGADLGAEKFLDIKCRVAGLQPKAVVVVATVRALKYNGGAAKDALAVEDTDALLAGLPNLIGHIENLRDVYGVQVIVAINKFITDTKKEIEIIKAACAECGAEVALSEAWEKGGAGSEALAHAVVKACEKPAQLRFAYQTDARVKAKIEAVATRIYGAERVEYGRDAERAIAEIEKNGMGDLPVCIAKTQYSFSDDPKKLARPKGFVFHVADVIPRTGAGFLVVVSGNIMLMPGLPKVPAAAKMTIGDDGHIEGLF